MNINQLKHLILDMDGVLWRGSTPMPGLAAFFDTLNRNHIRFVLATNNAAKTPTQYVKRLATFGVTITEADVITSATATASYLKEEYPAGTGIYIIGEEGLIEALDQAGFNVKHDDQLNNEFLPLVAVGFCRTVTYNHFAVATLLLGRGARFIGTNPDTSFPHELGPMPGAGSLMALLTAATGVEPTFIGKPGPIMFQEAMRRLGGTPQDTAMVGDRLNTDVAGGVAAGIKTILLLSGITTEADLAASELQPDWVLATLNDLSQAVGNS